MAYELDTLEILKGLSDSDKEVYLQLEQMFELPAWKYVQRWAEEQAAHAKDRAALAGNWEQNRISVGEWYTHSTYANLPTVASKMFEEAAAARLETAAEEQEEVPEAFL